MCPNLSPRSQSDEDVLVTSGMIRVLLHLQWQPTLARGHNRSNKYHNVETGTEQPKDLFSGSECETKGATTTVIAQKMCKLFKFLFCKFLLVFLMEGVKKDKLTKLRSESTTG